jgi:ABC-type dipeptide/oligopeptide/nickel transport system ATPase component
MNAPQPLLEVVDLSVSFHSEQAARPVQAVAGLSLTVHPGQTLAVVGESGCGKSVTAMTTLQLVPRPPGRIDGGRVLYGGRDLLSLSEKQMLAIRGAEIAMIFQEPMTSLNPVYTVGDQLIEAVLLHRQVTHQEALEIAREALIAVGVRDVADRLDDYPHQFSGGMRQRVMIAMALACRPKLLLADEPTTALDVTVQAQILELLGHLQESRGMAMMLITHNLGVVARTADVVCVMYAGRVVEYADVYELFERPMHPYTRGLLASIPSLSARREVLPTVREVVSDPAEFRRLPDASRGLTPWWPEHQPPAGMVSPVEEGAIAGDSMLHEVGPSHWVACWRTEAIAGGQEPRPDIRFRRVDAVAPAAGTVTAPHQARGAPEARA